MNISRQDGQDVQLTTDIDLQKKIAEIFKDHMSSVVVIDVNNGEILAYENNLSTSSLSNETLESQNTPSLPPRNCKSHIFIC